MKEYGKCSCHGQWWSRCRRYHQVFGQGYRFFGKVGHKNIGRLRLLNLNRITSNGRRVKGLLKSYGLAGVNISCVHCRYGVVLPVRFEHRLWWSPNGIDDFYVFVSTKLARGRINEG